MNCFDNYTCNLHKKCIHYKQCNNLTKCIHIYNCLYIDIFYFIDINNVQFKLIIDEITYNDFDYLKLYRKWNNIDYIKINKPKHEFIKLLNTYNINKNKISINDIDIFKELLFNKFDNYIIN